MSMKVVCAWCGKTLKDGPPEPLSHGICEACRAQHFGETIVDHDALDPIEHAASMINCCGGDAHEALTLAELNVQYAANHLDRAYWDRVGTAIVFQSTAPLLC